MEHRPLDIHFKNGVVSTGDNHPLVRRHRIKGRTKYGVSFCREHLIVNRTLFLPHLAQEPAGTVGISRRAFCQAVVYATLRKESPHKKHADCKLSLRMLLNDQIDILHTVLTERRRVPRCTNLTISDVLNLSIADGIEGTCLIKSGRAFCNTLGDTEVVPS